jgi:hypothetical protein
MITAMKPNLNFPKYKEEVTKPDFGQCQIDDAQSGA